MKRLVSVLLFVLMLGKALAQDINKSFYTQQRILERNGWAMSDNAAGLVFNDVSSFSDARISYGIDYGSLRNYDEAKRQNQVGIGTYSYQRLKKGYIYGSFDYNNKMRHDVAWNYMLSPYSTAFPLCDSVPGKQTTETYLLNGAFAYSLSKNVSLGLSIDYKVADNVKDKDVRNHNTLMDFDIRPGLLFGGRNIKVGVNAIYSKRSELINARVYGSGSTYVCYDYNYLWYYTPQKISSGGSMMREYTDNSYGGAAQLELVNNRTKWFTQLSVVSEKQKVYRNTVLTDRGGESESVIYKGLSQLSIDKRNWSNYLKVEAVYFNRIGYQNLQQTENVDGVSQIVQYGLSQTNRSQYAIGTFTYNLYRNMTDWQPKWNLEAVGQIIMRKESFYIFPIEMYSWKNTAKLSFSGDKYIYWGRNAVSFGASLVAHLGQTSHGEKYSGAVLPEMSNLERMQSIYDEDIMFNSTDRLGLNTQLQYKRIIQVEKGIALYANATWRNEKAMRGALKNSDRTNVAAQIGIRF
ncbi:MAG: DUF6850 family outer membrane beta-barrel protein [Marinifilaceae bacterium]